MNNVIWVDQNDNILGEVPREKAHREGLPHRISVIYLYNEAGEILVNERAKDGHLDHSSAGHVDAGESYLEAAKRELNEELGVPEIALNEIGSAKSDNSYNGFENVHIMKIFVCSAKPLKINPEEVKSVFWQHPKEILKDMEINPNKYADGFKSSIKIFLSWAEQQKENENNQNKF